MAKASTGTLLRIYWADDLHEDADSNPVLWNQKASEAMVESLLSVAQTYPLAAVKAAIAAGEQSINSDLFFEKVVIPNLPEILDCDLEDVRFVTANVAKYLRGQLVELALDKDADDAYFAGIREGFISLGRAFQTLSRTEKNEVTNLADELVDAFTSDKTNTRLNLFNPIFYHTSLSVRDQARRIAKARGCEIG